MRLIPFQIIDWTIISRTTHPGETGQVHSQTVQYPACESGSSNTDPDTWPTTGAPGGMWYIAWKVNLALN